MGLPLVFFDLVALRAVSFREELLYVRGVRKGERDVDIRRLEVVSRGVTGCACSAARMTPPHVHRLPNRPTPTPSRGPTSTYNTVKAENLDGV
jgi:hypothetical protein